MLGVSVFESWCSSLKDGFMHRLCYFCSRWRFYMISFFLDVENQYVILCRGLSPGPGHLWGSLSFVTGLLAALCRRLISCSARILSNGRLWWWSKLSPRLSLTGPGDKERWQFCPRCTLRELRAASAAVWKVRPHVDVQPRRWRAAELQQLVWSFECRQRCCNKLQGARDGVTQQCGRLTPPVTYQSGDTAAELSASTNWASLTTWREPWVTEVD